MRRVFATVALATFATLGLAGTAVAQQHCDSYSGACVEGKKTVKTPTKPTTDVGGINLPLTGAAITGMVVVGGAAVAGGTVLVTAGRRRRSAA